MKKILLLLFILYSLSSFGQNLVPNPSFEDTVACPNSVGEVYDCLNWNSFGNTPDYYNSCASVAINVPNTLFGYQQAAQGNAYCGLYNIDPSSLYREYIGCQLITPLQIGTRYFASFKVNLANNIGHNCKSNKIGILFSMAPYSTLNVPFTNNFAHVYSQNIISDTTNWQTVTGTFIADSSYQYIIIGNFFDNAHTDTLDCFSGAWTSYFYIDCVCVSTDSTLCYTWTGIPEYTNQLNPTIHISTNAITITINNQSPSEVILYDITGRRLLQESFVGTLSLDIEPLAKGIYLLAITNGKESLVKKVVKE